MDCQLTAIIWGGGGGGRESWEYYRALWKNRNTDKILRLHSTSSPLPPFPPAINNDQSLNRAEHFVYIIQFDGKDWKILEWEQTLLALLACPLHFKAGHQF